MYDYFMTDHDSDDYDDTLVDSFCNDDGDRECPTCNGTGEGRNEHSSCPTCKGKGHN